MVSLVLGLFLWGKSEAAAATVCGDSGFSIPGGAVLFVIGGESWTDQRFFRKVWVGKEIKGIIYFGCWFLGIKIKAMGF